MKFFRSFFVSTITLSLLVSLGFAGGASWALVSKLKTDEEKTIVDVVRSVDPAVVSVVISKDLPVLEEYYDEEEIFGNFRIITPRSRQVGTKKQEIGGGTAFFVSRDGLLITNQHVVSDTGAEYSVVTNDGQTYDVEVVNRNPELDLALLKITSAQKTFPIIRLSGSDTVELGQTVIAIGNALGEFRNTISKGIISGFGRQVLAENNQVYHEVIQTDAAINTGNSGGPLINTSGELIGVNFSVVAQAENISFAVPVSSVKQLLEGYDKTLLRKNNPRSFRQQQ